MQFVSSNSLPIAHPTKSLSNSLLRQITLSIAATGFVGLCAHISLPLPFTAVPLTLQTFAVILVGMVLGPVAGFSSMVLYLAEGAAGLPVFSPHGLGGVAQLMGPTAGFLFSYPLAAAAAGFFTRTVRLAQSNFRNGLIAGTVASLPIFLLGAAWLAHFSHIGITAAWYVAVAPFVVGEIVKVTAAAGIFTSLRRWRQSHS
ncbi:MAG: BioY protein [Acidobacteriaceae bacterium]|nr:BioY protein [Acidobacteriaceae bacterium]